LLQIPLEYLPGEFVLRFDYKEKPESTPYPSEKQILIYNQPLELWVHPMFANNPDSTWFQTGEKENAAFVLFSKENSLQMQKIGLLQQFLMEYDEPTSDFYLEGIKEYEKRRQAYNQWIDQKVKEDMPLFATSLYRFSFLPKISFQGSEQSRLLSVFEHYFDGIDFNDPIIIKTSRMNDWMNTYVNLHGQMATTVALRDSLIPVAAFKAIEKAKRGNPLVYGWMVDYFYRGFESNNLPQGMKVLQPYLDDPTCLTSKRMEIERRLKGMETIIPGISAPDFSLKDNINQAFNFKNFLPQEKYTLLLFWSADCSHCKETIDALYPWSQNKEIKDKLNVIAISLDETEAEVYAWEQKIKIVPEWKHLRALEGINSKVANDYFILATPVMVLINSKTKEIISLPENPEKLKSKIH
jgi:thioredoxin-related protein